ncbi:ATP-binding protein [Mucilaginibacter sp. X4EP1]|uniref:ATP-binding protein n=1 Tax=Mucilaginibacter sp. X4EP1 TaxID=2723092 RepID=UPI0021683847|nr:ATP-binding protein [Mucilaginibacter sp. X4EP1]MCS3816459.1 hypothetical protein [Mucilaginibacter sp. X4EP1]
MFSPADLIPKSNIENKVRNTSLPRTKPLLPLYEAISNSIHSIKELAKINESMEGKILISIQRIGSADLFGEIADIDEYPVNSYEIIDNGIGFNDENMAYFIESDTDHKIEIGGKGVGRFVCLKAFRKIIVDSNYEDNGSLKNRHFEYRSSREGIHDFKEGTVGEFAERRTKITLFEYKNDYQKNVPGSLFEIAREIVNHFLLYFIQDNAPKIIIKDDKNEEVNCRNLFLAEFQGEIQKAEFELGDYPFQVYLTKSNKSQSHKLHFCAHNRSVREEPLYRKIPDLGKFSIKDEDQQYYYQAYVVSKYLDDNVNQERVGFNFPTDEDEDEQQSSPEITLYKIRNKAVEAIEGVLADYLSQIRENKITTYKPIVEQQLPQYRAVFNHRLEQVKKLASNLPKDKLDIELYRLESDWKIEIKEEGAKLIEEKKNISNLGDYKARYEKFLTEFNEVGQIDLARYVVHRKTVIELLDAFLDLNNKEKFTDEDVIHSIFFPIKSSSDEVSHENQNLWLLDERLTYHSFLASDKQFDKINQIEVNSQDRTDLLIYNDALVFSEDKRAPFSSFTIVEFKKPQRNNFVDYDSEKNPIEQCERYINLLLEGKIKDHGGRMLNVPKNIPFFVYIVCDITPSLVKILENREYAKTPDGLGYFRFKNQYYNAYIEVLPFEKVLLDAKKRNRILFDKLGIS